MIDTKERIVADRQFATDRYILSTNPIFYVRLSKSDGAQFTEHGGAGRLCAVTGALWMPQGRQFDGNDDKVRIAAETNLEPGTGSWTIEIWCRMRTSTGTYQYPLYKGGDANLNAGYCFYRVEANVSLYFAISDGVNPYKTSSDGGNIADNASRHIVGVVDRTSARLKLYINAVEIGSPGTDISGFTGSLSNSNNPLDIGSKAGASALSGDIDTCLIYNRASSPLEITAHYISTKWRCR